MGLFPIPRSHLHRLVAAATLGHCRWPTSARLRPRRSAAFLQLRSQMEKHAPLSGQTDASSPGPRADNRVLASRGSDCHIRVSTAPRSWAALGLSPSSKRQLLPQTRNTSASRCVPAGSLCKTKWQKPLLRFALRRPSVQAHNFPGVPQHLPLSRLFPGSWVLDQGLATWSSLSLPSPQARALLSF